MNVELKKLTSVTTVTEAAMIKNRLEADGIPAEIMDDMMVTTDFLLGNAMGWIKVMVRATDWERAEAILAQRGSEDEMVTDEEVIAQGLAEAEDPESDSLDLPAPESPD